MCHLLLEKWREETDSGKSVAWIDVSHASVSAERKLKSSEPGLSKIQILTTMDKLYLGGISGSPSYSPFEISLNYCAACQIPDRENRLPVDPDTDNHWQWWPDYNLEIFLVCYLKRQRRRSLLVFFFLCCLWLETCQDPSHHLACIGYIECIKLRIPNTDFNFKYPKH